MEDKKYYQIIAAVCLIAVAIVAGFFYWLARDARKTLTSTPADNQPLVVLENPIPANIEQSLTDVYQDSKIPAALGIAIETEIAVSQLPQDIIALINPNKSYVLTKKVQFSDQQKGYKIHYQIPAILYRNQQYYIDLGRIGWTIVKAIYSNEVGLTKLQKDNFDILVEQSVIDAKNLNVFITVIEK